MTWTYDTSLLATSALPQVRLMIGDTNTAEQLLQDEEINWLVSQEGSNYLAAARAADTIAAKYAREVDIATTAGGNSIKASQAAAAYTKLAADLRGKARLNVAPYAGGISQSDKEANRLNSDRVTPAFWVDMEQNPVSPNPTDSDNT